MLILDRSRALDLMVAQASREPVPEEFSLGAGLPEAAAPRSGFRVAVYGPMPETPAPRPSWSWRRAGTAAAAM